MRELPELTEFSLVEVTPRSEIESNGILRFVVVYPESDETSNELGKHPDASQLIQLLKNANAETQTTRIYLNGMPRSGVSWAHSEFVVEKCAVWVREVAPAEFDEEKLWRKKHEFRTWNDKSGVYEITAAFLSRSGRVVSLLQKNGRKNLVNLDELCDEDIEYVNSL